MRKILMVKSDKFDLSGKKEEIQNVVELFSGYLDGYPTKNNSSKYEIMGPVAGILEMTKNKKRYSADFIKSRALRKHEMNKISGYVSAKTLKTLEDAVDLLISLRNDIPEMQVKKVMELIDGELYFLRRKKKIEHLEKIRKDFSNFMKQKYSENLDELNEKWEELYFDWEDLPYPSNKLEKGKNEIITRDIKEFKNKQKGDK